MKQCPKCNASIIDTAKFCSKCGVNIKKYEEENAKDRFCPECGTAITDGDFCTECGFKIGAVTTDAAFGSTDSFGDDWLGDIESSTDAAVAKTRENDAQWQIKQTFAAFEYEEHTDGTYTVTGLKDKTALQYTVPNNAVAISDHAFEGCNAIKITLPDTLLQIGSCAFKGCQNLSNINLPDSLMIVGDEAFAECEMLDIELPASIRKIGKDAIKNTVQDKVMKAKAEAEAKRKAELAKWDIGGTPTFGSYYQSGSKQPIEWTVLAREGSKALLISKYLLDCKQYNTENVSTTWETSSLRKWLNNGFLKEAFNDSEQQKIPCTKVSTPNNTTCNTNGGNTTTDKIFVLSIDEAKRYFAADDKRKCAPTAYAVSNGAGEDEKGCGLWWLRSPGDHYAAAIVNVDGGVYDYGAGVNITDVGVRPALWVDIDN